MIRTLQGSLLYEYATLSVKLEFTGGIVSKPTLYNWQSTGPRVHVLLTGRIDRNQPGVRKLRNYYSLVVGDYKKGATEQTVADTISLISQHTARKEG